MKCPIDNETLVMSERNGVEIDYCPKCRGVWLDRGELDKIINLSGPNTQHQSAYDVRPRQKDVQSRRPPRKKKKESLLSELFDF